MNLKELHNALTAVPKEAGESQSGEHKIIDKIFEFIEPSNKFFVDIGAGLYGRGVMSNTSHLLNKGWTGLMIDAETGGDGMIKKHFVTPDNITGILRMYGVPTCFDLLSIDIDSFDLDILDEVCEWHVPSVICTEYNGCLPPDTSVKLKHEEGYVWDETAKYGYSFGAGVKFAEKFGYRIVLNHANMNLFMIHKSVLGDQSEVPLTILAEQQFYHAYNPNAEWVEY